MVISTSNTYRTGHDGDGCTGRALPVHSGFARAEVSVLPFEYTALLWAVVIGYLVWNDFPDGRTWINFSIIVAAGLYALIVNPCKKSRTGGFKWGWLVGLVANQR